MKGPGAALALAAAVLATACGCTAATDGAGTAATDGAGTAAQPTTAQPTTARPAATGPTAGRPATAGSARPAAAGNGDSRLRYTYVADLSDGALARRYGYGLVDLGPSRAAIDALPAGERALVWLGGYSYRGCRFASSDTSVRRELAALAGDRKVAGYYIADEADDALPAYGGHCPGVVAQVIARNRLVRQLAPGAFTYEVITEPGNFAAFAHASDIMGADPYPCLSGHPCDWSKIPAYIAALRAAHVRRYWGVLQAFSYHDWRFPTPAELTRMIGQWQRSDWQGEQTYAWSYGTNSLASRPGLLAVLRQLNSGRL
jgi:hypothetical protein